MQHTVLPLEEFIQDIWRNQSSFNRGYDNQFWNITLKSAEWSAFYCRIYNTLTLSVMLCFALFPDIYETQCSFFIIIYRNVG